MFTDADIGEYFRQIHFMEAKMAAIYEQAAKDLPPGEYRDFFVKMMHEEHGHERFVAEMEKLFAE